eukprot:6717169-Prymnesium_polylepis.1
MCRIVGCMDVRAANYDPAATARGACRFAVSAINVEIFGEAAGCAISLRDAGNLQLRCPGREGCATSPEGTLRFFRNGPLSGVLELDTRAAAPGQEVRARACVCTHTRSN